MTRNTTPSWIARVSGSPHHERLRLLCFPYAGGAAHIYADWARALRAQVGLHTVMLPGRGRRFLETPLRSIEQMAQGVAEALCQAGDTPVAFFGHSMGALLAFETARQLRRSGGPTPRLLLLSAYRAPQLPRDTPPVHALPEAELLARLRDYEGTPAQVFDNPELLALMLPVVRADFCAVETYCHQPEPPLASPITAYGGLQDPHFGADAVAAWALQTSAGFSMRMLQGGHFFIHSAQDQLLAQVGAALEDTLASLPRRAVPFEKERV